MTWRPTSAGLVFSLLLAMGTCACERGTHSTTPSSPTSSPGDRLQPVALPDLSHADEGVREQARRFHADLLATMQAGHTDRELAAAYGTLAMFLHGAEYLDAALPCYRNAEALAPGDVRWPYGLALIFKSQGKTDDAIAAFRRALVAEPNDVTVMIWLARLHLDRGQFGEATTLLTKARTIAPRSAAVLAGLGQVAVAERRYDAAVRDLQDALTIEPGALSLHAPLANAYRALGRTDLADEHMKQWRNRELVVPDPHREQIDLMVRSGMSYELRGLKAMQARDWTTAADTFREGLAVASPGSAASRSLQHKLGTALYMGGDAWGAADQFREVLRTAPEGPDESASKAHYSLGVLLLSGGRMRDAIGHLQAAVRYRPDYGEAQLALADALRRTGQFEKAAASYREALRINPSQAEARLGHAVALVRLDRFPDARDSLTEGLVLQPGDPALTQALARILATSPDARARDGARALALAQALARQSQTLDVGETLAMAFAATGDYRTAVSVQKDVLAAATQAGLKDAATELTRNLHLYERQMPCRVPWSPQDPVHQPGPPVTRELVAVANAVADGPSRGTLERAVQSGSSGRGR